MLKINLIYDFYRHKGAKSTYSYYIQTRGRELAVFFYVIISAAGLFTLVLKADHSFSYDSSVVCPVAQDPACHSVAPLRSKIWIFR